MNDWIHKTARAFAEQMTAECEESELGLPIPLSLLQIPVQYADGDEPVHTADHPFCDDHRCPCHSASDYGRLVEEPLYRQIIHEPFQDGLLTVRESIRLFWGKNI